MRTPLSTPRRAVHAAVLALLGCGLARAQSDNQAVLDTWAQATGGAAPAVVKQDDGATRLEWQVQASNEDYSQAVSAPAGTGNGSTPNVHTPYAAGGHSKDSAAFSIRSISTDGSALFAQAALLASNDRAVLSRYAQQISSLQVGGGAGAYQWAAGDVAVNYSTLGSNLGLRGLMGQFKLDSLALSLHAGTVAESWEALMNRDTLNGQPVRTSFLRDVVGAKLDYEWSPGLHVFATTQRYQDRDGSLSTAPTSLPPAQSQVQSAGLQWQEGAWEAAVEGAQSRYEANAPARTGKAVFGTLAWRGTNVLWRGGISDVSAVFAPVGGSAAPGTEEAYVSSDWQAAPTVSVGLELRGGAQKTAATEITPATRTPFVSLSGRGSVNLGDWLPGLSAQLQDMHTRRHSPAGSTNETRQTNLGLGYAITGWSATGGLSWSGSSDAASPASDSTTTGWQASLGRQWTGDPTAAPWSLNLNLMANAQDQRLASTGSSTRSRSAGLALAAQHPSWGSWNLNLMEGDLTQPLGGPVLRQRSLQFDAAYPLARALAVKAYWHYNERNAGSEALRTLEQVAGLQFMLTL